MKSIKYLLMFSLAFVLTACGLTISSNTGDTTTLTINEPVPADGALTDVKLTMAAGKLQVQPGSSNLIEGTVNYNVTELEPEIERKTAYFGIIQSAKLVNINPSKTVINEWTFKLGNSPMKLTLEAGASDANLDLSGIPLANLYITDGASNCKIFFNSPNPITMDEFLYRTGASSVEITGLANANIKNLEFDSGAGSYKLDFSGQLRQDMRVGISSGVSDITITCPVTTACKVTVYGELNSVTQTGTWLVTNNVYQNSGQGNLISIFVTTNVGSINLISK
jgi:hypothetical protein